ncbi:MAG: TIGR04283 family arsenosugar biosynthesis glycosyltransferase [Steroidobacteraceae bacterium]
MAQANSFSVVVPTLNEAACIAALCRSLSADGFEDLIVVDGGSSDDTVAIARQAGATVLETPPGRGNQLNAGARLARGEVLLFLHADTLLPPDAPEAMDLALCDAAVVAGCFRLRFAEGGGLLGLYAWFSRFDTRFSTFGDQGFFMRRAAFDQAGGFPAQPLMEDVDMRRRLRRIGRFVKLATSVTTSARRFARDGVLRRQLANGVLLLCHALGVAPERLARWYG